MAYNFTQTLSLLSNDDLATMVKELNELHLTGILQQGRVREFSQEVARDMGISPHDAMNFVPHGIMREAANRFISIYTLL